MGKKPETVGRRVATEEEIAKVLGGFEEEMLADLYRRKEEELRKRPKAKVLEFPAKLSEQELIRRQLVIDQTWERVVEQRRKLEERGYHRGPGDSDWNL
jgi:hypothetical protein